MVKVISGVREFIDRIVITILLCKRCKTKEKSFLTNVPKYKSIQPKNRNEFNEWVQEFNVSFLYIRTHELSKNS